MANFTMELGHLVTAGYVASLSTYPIFDETYRAVLNQKILDHYRFHEIGLETPDRFDFYLKTRMNEIMPYYNRLYLANLDLVDPLRNVDLTETNTKQTSGMNVSSTSSSDDTTVKANKGKVTNKLANSDTPQGDLSIMSLTAGGYASNVQIGEQAFDEDSTVTAGLNSMSTAGEGATTEEYTKTLVGVQGVSKPELMIKFRDALINIDVMIINALNDLFMGVF